VAERESGKPKAKPSYGPGTQNEAEKREWASVPREKEGVGSWGRKGGTSKRGTLYLRTITGNTYLMQLVQGKK